jgi:ABC-type glutathione transport system ATPase component
MGMAIMLITHDLGVIAEMCDDVVVMYAGRVAESGPVQPCFRRPSHPYTRGLLIRFPALKRRARPASRSSRAWCPSLKELPGLPLPEPLSVPRSTRVRPPAPRSKGRPGHEVACHRWRELPASAVDSPSPHPPPPRCSNVQDLRMHFPVREGVFLRARKVCRAVDGVPRPPARRDPRPRRRVRLRQVHAGQVHRAPAPAHLRIVS